MLNLTRSFLAYSQDARIITELIKRKTRIYFAIDSTLISSYINLPFQNSHNINKDSINDLFFHYFSVAIIFEAIPQMKDFFETPFLLLPPYEVEMRDILNYRKQYISSQLEKFDRKISSQLDYDAMFSSNDIVNNIIQRLSSAGTRQTISSEEAQELIKFLYSNFSDLWLYFMTDQNSLQKKFNVINTEINISNHRIKIPKLTELSLELIDNLFAFFAKNRKSIKKRFANYVDSIAITYVDEINSIIHKNNEVLFLISNAPSMFTVQTEAELSSKIGRYTQESLCIPLVIHPFALTILLIFGLGDTEISDVEIKIDELEKNIATLLEKYDLSKKTSIDSFLDQVLQKDIFDNIVSTIRLNEIRYTSENHFIFQLFKGSIDNRIVQVLEVLKESKSEWDNFRDSLLSFHETYKKMIDDCINTHREKTVRLQYLIVGGYLFNYYSLEVNELIDRITLGHNIDDVINELNQMKLFGAGKNFQEEPFHLSAYLLGKLERFDEARRDIEDGLKMCKIEDERIKFYYLENINLSNTYKLDEAFVRSIEYSKQYGPKYPRFYLHTGYLAWQLWKKNRNKPELLDQSIDYTKKSLQCSIGNEPLHHKCLLLGYANLVSFFCDAGMLERAKEYLDLLTSSYTCYVERFVHVPELPLFVFVKARYLICKASMAKRKERAKYYNELTPLIQRCEQNILLVNKSGRLDYFQLIDKYKNLFEAAGSYVAKV